MAGPVERAFRRAGKRVHPAAYAVAQMADLSDYKVTLSKVPLFGTWTWRVRTPNARELTPFGMGFAAKAAAEANALRRIEADLATEQVDGQALQRRVASHSESHARPAST